MVVCVYTVCVKRERERERGLLLEVIVFRGKEIACLAAVRGPLIMPSRSVRSLAFLAAALGPCLVNLT